MNDTKSQNAKDADAHLTCPHCFGERSLGDCQVTQRLHEAALSKAAGAWEQVIAIVNDVATCSSGEMTENQQRDCRELKLRIVTAFTAARDSGASGWRDVTEPPWTEDQKEALVSVCETMQRLITQQELSSEQMVEVLAHRLLSPSHSKETME